VSRYEVRVIGDEQSTSLGSLLHTCDDAADAKEMAFDLASHELYGVAVLDTVAGLVDWGQGEVTPVAGVLVEDAQS
jgi:hypothetical protein